MKIIERRISEKSVNFGGGNLTQFGNALVWTGLEHVAYEHKTHYHDLLGKAVKE